MVDDPSSQASREETCGPTEVRVTRAFLALSHAEQLPSRTMILPYDLLLVPPPNCPFNSPRQPPSAPPTTLLDTFQAAHQPYVQFQRLRAYYKQRHTHAHLVAISKPRTSLASVTETIFQALLNMLIHETRVVCSLSRKEFWLLSAWPNNLHSRSNIPRV
ncbi:unnamed protein product [Protopolystoma xenopodis]|uniref:Uncharacterized protein n=1 Tax=Protopolystoma xenopodis TaxID=117903 RepID=A0A3S5B0W5_9PLAT|nr:unnamed protein product [Protopolystoma xenopodis]